jgi:transcription initiation factor TFIIH subunit 2
MLIRTNFRVQKGNADGHIRALREMMLSSRSGAKTEGKTYNLYQGSMSIQNALVCAFSSHRSLPRYGRREVLMVLGAMASLDPSHPASCLPLAVSSRTSISIIHIAAEIFICKRLASETGGMMAVPVAENHLVQLLDSYATQGPSISSEGTSDSVATNARLLIMGFPRFEELEAMERDGDDSNPDMFSDIQPRYTCPRCLHCLPETTSLPTNCTICRLMLVKAQQLARSYSHLFPQPSLSPFIVPDDQRATCIGCFASLPPTSEVSPPEPTQTSSSSNKPSTAGASSTANNPFGKNPLQATMPIVSPALSCYRCNSCESTFCGLCKEAIVGQLHQCIGCLERQ